MKKPIFSCQSNRQVHKCGNECPPSGIDFYFAKREATIESVKKINCGRIGKLKRAASRCRNAWVQNYFSLAIKIAKQEIVGVFFFPMGQSKISVFHTSTCTLPRWRTFKTLTQPFPNIGSMRRM